MYSTELFTDFCLLFDKLPHDLCNNFQSLMYGMIQILSTMYIIYIMNKLCCGTHQAIMKIANILAMEKVCTKRLLSIT